MAIGSVVAGCLPVLLFLGGLRLMDSFKLVHRRLLLLALLAGVLAAIASFLGNQAALSWGHVSREQLRAWFAPVLEEVLKAAVVAWWIHRDRVGFLVDAAILGFAVGAGFALTENLYYAFVLRDPSFALWLVRGLGTAVMHGSTTAIFAVLGKTLSDRYPGAGLRAFAPGLVLGMLLHALFNQLPLSPFVTTSVLVGIMPLLLMLVFEYSERATGDWLASGFDGEIEMLERILAGEVERTPVGAYLESLRSRFSPMVVADLFCLLTIHLELALRAKGLLLARAAGLDVPVDETVRANLEELRFLERSVGPTGRMAILPLRRTSRRDLWQILLLQRGDERGRRAGAPPPTQAP